jgi:hypothetical protein
MTDDIRRELDQLRTDIQREIDLRLKAEADARASALNALTKRELDVGQMITWILSAGAVALAALAFWHQGR